MEIVRNFLRLAVFINSTVSYVTDIAIDNNLV